MRIPRFSRRMLTAQANRGGTAGQELFIAQIFSPTSQAQFAWLPGVPHSEAEQDNASSYTINSPFSAAGPTLYRRVFPFFVLRR
jgi:hypothetical protein